MNRNEAQLREDYGSNSVGNVGGIPVNSSDEIYDKNKYELQYDGENKRFNLVNVMPSSVDVTVAAATGTIYETAVSTVQTGLTVANGKITGTLHNLESGPIPAGYGPGYYMALQLSNFTDAMTSVKVGLLPSVSSGLVEILTDPDKNGVFKVTDKDNQKFVVQITTADGIITHGYDLSELVLD
jgi:hypothetical protein